MTGDSTTKHVFHAFSAYVGQLSGQTSCKFWPDDPSTFRWDLAHAFHVDLSKTPSAARAGTITWDQVEVDDHTTNGGLTSIGPRFPSSNMIGGVWVHEQHMARIGLQECAKPQHAFPYELRCMLYVGDKQFGDRRFHGFHAESVGPQAMAGTSTVTRLKVWNGGQGMGGGNASMWWIDLADAADMTESTVGLRGATSGSLYLDADKRQIVMAGGGTGPKLPRSFGY
jgi:hypothetical protein